MSKTEKAMSLQEQAVAERLFARMAKAGVSVTTGVTTDSDGTREYWRWWDLKGGCSEGRSVKELAAYLDSREAEH